MSVWVDQKVLRLDVSMNDFNFLHLIEGFKHLKCVKFDKNHGYVLTLALVMLNNAFDCGRYKLHNNVAIHFIFLKKNKQVKTR